MICKYCDPQNCAPDLCGTQAKEPSQIAIRRTALRAIFLNIVNCTKLLVPSSVSIELEACMTELQQAAVDEYKESQLPKKDPERIAFEEWAKNLKPYPLNVSWWDSKNTYNMDVTAVAWSSWKASRKT